MEKEHHITYSIDTNQEGFKNATFRINRIMTENGAEFISKNDDYDGFVELIFHKHGTHSNVSSIVNSTMKVFEGSPIYISAHVAEHNPQVLVDFKDVKNYEDFFSFIKQLSEKHNSTSLSVDEKETSMFNVAFNKSKDRQNFQNDYVALADKYMNLGQSSVNIFPNWEDITVLEKNNSTTNKKQIKYGY